MDQETIVETISGHQLSFTDLVDRLAPYRIVYIGEQHPLNRHHEIQLQIIKALADKNKSVCIGMEMFDHTYQQKLDQWSSGDLTWPEFLRQVHWYANWKYPADLYKEILLFVQSHSLALVGLNIPFYLSPKIAIGGLDSLSTMDRSLLPKDIDTSQADHRAYLETIFDQHHFHGKGDFQFFYEAQCAWEDGMAQKVAENLDRAAKMVVIAGNGHIIHKFGIPERANKRRPAPYCTIILGTSEMDAASDDGDFIWTTAPGTQPDNGRP